jgi:hypothetical protein
VGLVEPELKELRVGKCPASLSSTEQRTWKTTSLLAKDGELSDGDYSAEVTELGESAIFTLVSVGTTSTPRMRSESGGCRSATVTARCSIRENTGERALRS